MGEMCSRNVIDFEFLGAAIVTDPFDKYGVIHPEGMEYNYEMLELLVNEIKFPYDSWYIDELQMIKPEYQNIERNSACPCGSGRKLKNVVWELLTYLLIIFA